MPEYGANGNKFESAEGFMSGFHALGMNKLEEVDLSLIELTKSDDKQARVNEFKSQPEEVSPEPALPEILADSEPR